MTESGGLGTRLLSTNGPFGVGKTQAAYELHRRLPGSFVCDPEHLGFGLQRMTPPDLRGDFQDMPLWRAGVLAVLDANLTRLSGVLIVPMTLVSLASFGEIVGGLRQRGHTVHHVTLLASRQTLIQRLRSRGEGPKSWGAAQIQRCLTGLAQLDPADALQTEQLRQTSSVTPPSRTRSPGVRICPSRLSVPRRSGKRSGDSLSSSGTGAPTELVGPQPPPSLKLTLMAISSAPPR